MNQTEAAVRQICLMATFRPERSWTSTFFLFNREECP